MKKHQLSRSIDIRIFRDLSYATQSESQKLDIYMVPESEGPSPVIMWMHPGGFHEGDKDGSSSIPLARVNLIKLFQPMLERGYSVVSMNYRLSQEAIFPALIFDVKAAVRWIKANSSNYGFDPKNIVAWGSSAGGYLAAMLATTAEVPELEDLTMGNPDQSSEVKVAVDWFGPIHFGMMDDHHIQLGEEAQVHEADSPESRLMGAPVNEIPEKCDLASPITHITSKSAPIFIQQGSADPTISYPQSTMLEEKMSAAIGKDNVFLEIVEGVGHADEVFFTLENIHKILDFVDKYVK